MKIELTGTVKTQAELAADPEAADREWKQQVMLALIPQYMKPGTQTTAEGHRLEAERDAARMEAAYRAIVAIVL